MAVDHIDTIRLHISLVGSSVLGELHTEPAVVIRRRLALDGHLFAIRQKRSLSIHGQRRLALSGLTAHHDPARIQCSSGHSIRSNASIDIDRRIRTGHRDVPARDTAQMSLSLIIQTDLVPLFLHAGHDHLLFITYADRLSTFVECSRLQIRLFMHHDLSTRLNQTGRRCRRLMAVAP